MSAALCLVPLIEDDVHSLGQVVHGAVSSHRWVPLITGPDGRTCKDTRLKTRSTGKKQEQTAASVNKKDSQIDAISHFNNTECIQWNRAGRDGLRRFWKGKLGHAELLYRLAIA